MLKNSKAVLFLSLKLVRPETFGPYYVYSEIHKHHRNSLYTQNIEFLRPKSGDARHGH